VVTFHLTHKENFSIFFPKKASPYHLITDHAHRTWYDEAPSKGALL
jgi:hypothetical protein